MKKYYVVKNGRVPGIYTTWTDCKAQVDGYSGAVYKSFTAKADAMTYWEVGDQSGAPDDVTQISTEAWAYVDGSYIHSQRRYSYGMVICVGEQEYEFSRAFDDAEMAAMRNVAGEITASMQAVEFCLQRKIDSITIFYDYAGIGHWANGEWKTNNPYTAAYAEFIKRAREEMQIIFVKVKGHSGDEYNDRADRLAKSALGIE